MDHDSSSIQGLFIIRVECVHHRRQLPDAPSVGLKRVESFRVHVDRVVFVRAEVAAAPLALEASRRWTGAI